MKILAKLAIVNTFTHDALALLIGQLKDAPVNQLPTYAEQTLAVLAAPNLQVLELVLLSRLAEVAQEPKRKRLEKVLKKLQAQKIAVLPPDLCQAMPIFKDIILIAT